MTILDPDFGWHLKMGERIVSGPFPFTDPLSYTMYSYPYVDHEWGSDVILFLLYRIGGIVLLSVSVSVITLCSLFAVLSYLRVKKWEQALLLLFSGALISPFLENRPLVISWLLFAGVLIALQEPSGKKQFFMLPLLFFLWTNLHGSFPIGLVFVLLSILYSFVKRKITFVRGGLLLLTCIIATFLSPYGIGGWKEFFQTMMMDIGNTSLIEWQQGFTSSSFLPLCFFVLLAFSGMVMFRKKFSALEWGEFVFLCIFSITAQRFIPYALLVTNLLLAKSVSFFTKETISQKYLVVLSLISLFLIVTSFRVSFFQANAFSENNAYPKQATLYILSHPFKGHLLTIYNWGGYVLWKFPGQKDFVDGRMVNWHVEKTDNRQSLNAFAQLSALLSGELSFKYVANQYCITTVLIPSGFLETNREFIKNLRDNHLSIRYRDSRAAVFE